MILNIQYLRAFAAINVVFLHVLIGADSYSRPTEYLSFFGNWGASGVDIFFVISGFVMIYTQINNPKNIFSFYKSRLKRILPIYWLITCFVIFLYLIFPEIFKQLKIDFNRAITNPIHISSHWEWTSNYKHWLDLRMGNVILFDIWSFNLFQKYKKNYN